MDLDEPVKVPEQAPTESFFDESKEVSGTFGFSSPMGKRMHQSLRKNNKNLHNLTYEAPKNTGSTYLDENY